MAKVKNITIEGSGGKPIALDVFFNESGQKQPTLIYAHGFNGFKDWGNFDLIAEQFLASGFAFVKFNFSHNGTTPAQPETFSDLEAFGENNYTKQLADLDSVINWVTSPLHADSYHMDVQQIGLIGHSMGGGICIIKTAEDRRIKALVTWAAIAACKTPWGNWAQQRLSSWKQQGVEYYINGRTKQQMPLYYQLYEDFIHHQDRLDILKAAAQIKVPWLICHGTEDLTVPFEQANSLHAAHPSAQLFTVSADHVFGRKHPWNARTQP